MLCPFEKDGGGFRCPDCGAYRTVIRSRPCPAKRASNSPPQRCPHLLGPAETDTGDLLHAKTPKKTKGCGSCGTIYVSECELFGLISELRTDATLDGERLPSCVGCEKRPG